MTPIEVIASEAYNAYWLCTLNGQYTTVWEDLQSEVKETWMVVAKSVLVSSVQQEVLYA
ncbi:MAG: hypothetical protein KME47_09475 [Nodosilinea sp. WJT8-NPBG4]|jgi:hypothetical protein|nr:hypothetical protein [Nodosilinea sp. WJT8-NPBG4]